ncbi:MAG: insulinase family protein [Pelagimonas sp.]|jgi:zinc protease|nr:insulinase family protein [Pelagimonas sp.]
MIRYALAVALAFTGAVAQAEITVQQVESPGGIKAWLVEEPSIPFVALELRFQGGGSLDLPGKRGAVNLMTGLLEEGAGDMDAQAFTQAKESIAAQFRYDMGDDAVSVSAKFLTETQDQAIDLLRETLIAPRFDQAAIDRVRQQVLSGIASDAKDPESIASNAFYAQIYGDHPYGSDHNGTIESVSGLTRDDLLAAHQGTMARDRVFVGAAGDISAEELGVLLDHLLGDLPATGLAQPDDIEVQTTADVSVIPFETPQSVAMFGHAGIPRDDPDFFPAFVMNQIFGGSGFEARLMDEVREKRGLTYGIGTYLVDKDHSDLMLGQVASANDRIAETIQVIRDEWAKLAQNGVTADELELIKTYLTGAYPLRFDGNGQIARILVGMQMQGLTPEYIETRNDKINAVTLEDVKRVAARLIQPDQLKFVVVGQPQGL